MDSLCALVPVTSKGRSSPSHCLEGLRLLGASLSSGATDGAPTPALSVVLGLDSDDPLVDLAEEACNCFLPGVHTAVRMFGGGELAAQRRQCDGEAPICWMWNELALEAQSAFQAQPQWMVLLGEDTRMQPAGWPALLARQVEAAGPALRCVALLDAADPGFPSFPVMHASHLQLFGSMVPREFVNQGGDPLLYALYRSIGAAAVCPTVTVHNTGGGMQGSIFAPPATSAAQQPRYDRRPLPVAQWRSLLQAWRQQLLASLPQARARLQVAVAVPAGRVDCAVLETILERSRSSDEQVDVSVFFQIDCPLALVAPAAAERLRELQRAHPDRLRIRVNSNNKGAAATRNALLDEAAACDLVVFYDDDVLPAPSCLDAYVAAFRAHPNEAGFAGPTYLPRLPSQLLPTTIHMSDVSFFWEAPGRLGEFVPWAVTANMAVAGGTPARFRPGFPMTGGGEDVDFCIQLGARLRAVPGAAAEHPWWPEGRPRVYRRFWRWAEGDGRLIDLWPQLTYARAPNPAELCLLLLVLAVPLVALRLASIPALAAALCAVLATDLLADILRNCCVAERRLCHPCAHWMRPLAAAEAWLIACLASEGGRLAGALKRGSCGSLCRNFDWFCGSQPAVVRGEQWRAAGRAGACVAAGVAATLLLRR